MPTAAFEGYRRVPAPQSDRRAIFKTTGRRERVPSPGRPSSPRENPDVARKPNYSFEKRKRELDKKMKKDEKRQQRLEAAQHEAEEASPESPEASPPE
jgi:hypothetical protein